MRLKENKIERNGYKKAFVRVLSLLLCAVLAAGCGSEEDADDGVTKRQIFAMDTYMELTAQGKRSQEAVDAAIAEIHRLEELLSTEKTDSETGRINKNGSGKLGAETEKLAAVSLDVYKKTGGAFDITIYPLMLLWGFTGDSPAVPDSDELSKCLKKVGANRLSLSGNLLTLGEGQGIDFGGIAKGYASDRVMEIFGEYDVNSGIVSLGGNVQCCGTKADGSLWRCGILDPSGTGYLGILQTSDRAVITSGGYERFFEEDGISYHHILDPETGYPAQTGIVSASVISENGVLADALSTACFVMGEKRSLDYWQEYGLVEGESFELILMNEEGEVIITEGLEDFFTTDYPLTVIRRNDG